MHLNTAKRCQGVQNNKSFIPDQPSKDSKAAIDACGKEVLDFVDNAVLICFLSGLVLVQFAALCAILAAFCFRRWKIKTSEQESCKKLEAVETHETCNDYLSFGVEISPCEEDAVYEETLGHNRCQNNEKREEEPQYYHAHNFSTQNTFADSGRDSIYQTRT